MLHVCSCFILFPCLSLDNAVQIGREQNLIPQYIVSVSVSAVAKKLKNIYS